MAPAVTFSGPYRRVRPRRLRGAPGRVGVGGEKIVNPVVDTPLIV